MPRVELDTNRCAGHALCHAVAPDVYDLDDYGYCVLAHHEIDEALRGPATAGAEACPEGALTVSDD